MNRYLPPDRVKLSPGWSDPIWPSEPDVTVIKDLVASALKVEKDFSVQFLAEGAFHKVYEVSNPSWSTVYIFRVAIAVFPFYKIESEMATMEFLRQRTSIPVPKPIAWSSSSKGKLGYEWALLEKIPGVQLDKVWNKVSWDKKLEISHTMATYLAQLWKPSNRFSKIGSVYFAKSQDKLAEARSRVLNSANPFTEMTRVDEIRDHGFVIGPATDGYLTEGRRLHLRPDLGPFDTCREWVEENVRMSERLIRSADLTMAIGRERVVTTYSEEEWIDIIEEVDGSTQEEEWPAELESMAKTCQAYRRLLPKLFSRSEPAQNDDPQFCLFHCDLRDANILVDPDTFAITGIIDWEATCTVPDWYGVDYPLLLNTQEPLEDDEPRIPKTYDEDSPDYSTIDVLLRSLWEYKLLRGHFDQSMEQVLGRKDWRPRSSSPGSLKFEYYHGQAQLHNDARNAESSLKELEDALETNSVADGCLEKEVSVYLGQRRWKEAEYVLAHCLEKSKVTLGTQDPKMLNIMASLALTLRRQDRWDEAERLETQVLEARNRLLGRWHPDTLNSMSSLAETHTFQGRFFAAKELEKRALVMRMKMYGEEHPATLRSTAALAKIYGKVNRSNHGLKMLKRVLETNKRLLGDDHLDTLGSMADLACHYSDLDLFIDTEQLGRRVLEKRKVLLGDEHPETLNSMASLARLYNRQRRFQIAIDMQVHVLETRERLFGAEHCDTLNAMVDLSTTYYDNRRLVEAEELQLQVLETRKTLLGDDHPTTLAITVDLISTYSSQYQWHKAMPLSAQVLEAEKTLREQRSSLPDGSASNPTPTNDSRGRSSPESVGTQASYSSSGWSGGRRSSLETTMTELSADGEDASGENPSPALGATKSSSTDDSQEQQGKAKDPFAGISAAELISIYAQLEKNAGNGVEHVPATAGLLSVDGSQGGQGEQEETDELLSLGSSTTCATSNDSDTDAPGKAGKIDEQTIWTRRLNKKRSCSDLEYVAKRQRGLGKWYKSVYEEACTIM